MQDAITFAAGVRRVRGRDEPRHKSYRAYRFAKSDRAVRLAADALGAAASSRATSSPAAPPTANVFNERGLQCVNLANGMTEIHTPDEHIAVADIEAMVDVTLALVDAARSQ